MRFSPPAKVVSDLKPSSNAITSLILEIQFFRLGISRIPKFRIPRPDPEPWGPRPPACVPGAQTLDSTPGRRRQVGSLDRAPEIVIRFSVNGHQPYTRDQSFTQTRDQRPYYHQHRFLPVGQNCCQQLSSEKFSVTRENCDGRIVGQILVFSPRAFPPPTHPEYGPLVFQWVLLGVQDPEGLLFKVDDIPPSLRGAGWGGGVWGASPQRGVPSAP